jgi:uncharacterized protein YbaR (Trm112 family)
MKVDFICPNCHGYLNVGDKIIFTIRKSGRSGGMLLMSPVLGEYSYENHPAYPIKKGEEFDFLCPICHADLSVHGQEKLAKVIMREDGDTGTHEFYIVFSRKQGERCTFKIAEKNVETYGEAAHKYVDFVNASMLK